MTTAQMIQSQLEGAVAVTLQGGYAILPSTGRVTFEAARITGERRNRNGRCTRLTATYADGSKLLFTWSDYQGPRYRSKP